MRCQVLFAGVHKIVYNWHGLSCAKYSTNAMRSQEVFATPRKLSQSAKSKIGADFSGCASNCQGLYATPRKLKRPRATDFVCLGQMQTESVAWRQIVQNFGRFGKIKLDIF